MTSWTTLFQVPNRLYLLSRVKEITNSAFAQSIVYRVRCISHFIPAIYNLFKALPCTQNQPGMTVYSYDRYHYICYWNWKTCSSCYITSIKVISILNQNVVDCRKRNITPFAQLLKIIRTSIRPLIYHCRTKMLTQNNKLAL